MAELETKKDKYGVAVAARIDLLLAQQIAERAMALQLSFSSRQHSANYQSRVNCLSNSVG